MWHRHCRSRNCFKGNCSVDIETVKIIERIKRRMHWMKHDATARSDYTTKQNVEELQALFEMLEKKIAD